MVGRTGGGGGLSLSLQPLALSLPPTQGDILGGLGNYVMFSKERRLFWGRYFIPNNERRINQDWKEALPASSSKGSFLPSSKDAFLVEMLRRFFITYLVQAHQKALPTAAIMSSLVFCCPVWEPLTSAAHVTWLTWCGDANRCKESQSMDSETRRREGVFLGGGVGWKEEG